MLTSSYPRSVGDFAGLFIADAVECLRARGLEVKVVHPSVPIDRGGLVRLLRRRPWLLPKLFLRLLVDLRRAARDADLVHAHWLLSAPLARLSGRPFVVTLHGTGSAGRLSDLSLAANTPRLVRLLLRRARSVICVSTLLAETMEQIGVERVRWIPNGLAIPAAPIAAAEEPFVLYAGRLTPEKGIADLIEACRDLRLVVAGDGPLRSLVPGALGFVPTTNSNGSTRAPRSSSCRRDKTAFPSACSRRWRTAGRSSQPRSAAFPTSSRTAPPDSLSNRAIRAASGRPSIVCSPIRACAAASATPPAHVSSSSVTGNG